MQSVGKVAEEAGSSTWKPPGDPKAHVHGRLDAGTSSTEFFFFIVLLISHQDLRQSYFSGGLGFRLQGKKAVEE